MSLLPKTEPIWLERYAELFASTDRVLCEGPFMASTIVELGCPADKVHVHRLGIEVDKIAFVPRQWSPGTPLKVLIASSFTEKKGIPYAIAALAPLKDEVPVEVTIVGDARPYPGPEKEKRRILDAIERGRLAPMVRMLGYQPHSRLYEEAYRNHIFLSPSVTAQDGDTEGGAPVTIIEMMATGMPVVSTYHCDIPSLIDPGRTGFLARERDVDGLVAALRCLIQSSGDWSPMLRAARQHVEREYDARTQGSRLAAIYEELAA
jgi:colanic acid/amylovoran biosynthesis glycosyltransferase